MAINVGPKDDASRECPAMWGVPDWLTRVARAVAEIVVLLSSTNIYFYSANIYHIFLYYISIIYTYNIYFFYISFELQISSTSFLTQIKKFLLRFLFSATKNCPVTFEIDFLCCVICMSQIWHMKSLHMSWQIFLWHAKRWLSNDKHEKYFVKVA